MTQRICVGCGITDTDPRHVLVTDDGATVLFHMDCHAIVANCETCRAQIADAAGATGDELRAHLITTGPAADRLGWTSPDQRSAED